jgi:hypothetical protein
MGLTHDKVLYEVAERLGYEIRPAMYFDRWWILTHKITKEKTNVCFDNDEYIANKEILDMILIVANEMYDEYF